MQLVLSLMPGIDLLGMAFQQECFCVVRGGDPIFGGDVRHEHYPAGKFEGVISGPPCQSFSSLAHLVRASGREPKFGNLIPEFERCIEESRPDWFLMENVRAAPVPVVAGYQTHTFLLENSLLPGGDNDGFGQEQMRLRKITFGRLGQPADNLMKYIDLAPLILPDAVGTQTQWAPDNSQEAKGRMLCVTSTDGWITPSEKTRAATVTGNDGGQGKGQSPPRDGHEAVTGGHDKPPSKRIGNSHKQRTQAVCAMEGGESKRTDSGRVYARRYKLADAVRLQGLPEGFLDDAPFTAQGKLKAVANGVSIPMGRALARAIKEAING